MGWILLIIAGAGEVLGVMGINQVNKKKNLASLVMLFTGFIISFLFLSLAMRTISMGTAYAVWTGIGTAGSVLVGMLFFNESKDWKRVFFILLIISSVIGLKLIS